MSKKTDLELELKNMEAERDAAHLELGRYMDLRASERAAASKRIHHQRRELHRLNLAVRSANFVADQRKRWVESDRAAHREWQKTMNARYETLRQELDRLKAEAKQRKAWWHL